MKNVIFLLFLGGIVSILFAFKKVCFKKPTEKTFKNLHVANQATVTGVDLDNYVLFFQDDFNGNTLDTKIWNYRRENVPTKNEFGVYNVVLRSNITVNNGVLRMTVNKLKDSLFARGMIATEEHPQYWFKYGYFECRAKLPQNVGTGCAFWIQSPTVISETNNPSINGVEIDVLEYGKAAGVDSIFQSLVWNGYGSNRKLISSHVKVPGVSNGFHTFALEWTPKEYIAYIDGAETARTSTAVSHRKEFIILSAGTGGFAGNPLNRYAVFPDHFEVDYVKMYKRKPAVMLYGQDDFYGWVSPNLIPGSYTTTQLQALGITNNDASSMEVPDGWTVIAYDGDNFTGDSTIISTDSRSAGYFDNRLSSLKIKSQ